MNLQTPLARQHGRSKAGARERTRCNWIFAELGALAVLIVAATLLLRQPARPAPPPAIPVYVAKATAAASASHPPPSTLRFMT